MIKNCVTTFDVKLTQKKRVSLKQKQKIGVHIFVFSILQTLRNHNEKFNKTEDAACVSKANTNHKCVTYLLSLGLKFFFVKLKETISKAFVCVSFHDDEVIQILFFCVLMSFVVKSDPTTIKLTNNDKISVLKELFLYLYFFFPNIIETLRENKSF